MGGFKPLIIIGNSHDGCEGGMPEALCGLLGTIVKTVLDQEVERK
jgi:hypothetical protein